MIKYHDSHSKNCTSFSYSLGPNAWQSTQIRASNTPPTPPVASCSNTYRWIITMKRLYCYLIFLLLYIRGNTAAASGDRSYELGVRVLINRGLITESIDCSDEENDSLRQIMLDNHRLAVQPNQRNLRASTLDDLPICDDICHEYAPDTCFLLGPCRHDKELSRTPPADELSGNALLNAELRHQCREKKNQIGNFVRHSIMESGLSQNCKSFLGKRIDMQCHIIWD